MLPDGDGGSTGRRRKGGYIELNESSKTAIAPLLRLNCPPNIRATFQTTDKSVVNVKNHGIHTDIRRRKAFFLHPAPLPRH